jgi:hypothetical protein
VPEVRVLRRVAPASPRATVVTDVEQKGSRDGGPHNPSHQVFGWRRRKVIARTSSKRDPISRAAAAATCLALEIGSLFDYSSLLNHSEATMNNTPGGSTGVQARPGMGVADR